MIFSSKRSNTRQRSSGLEPCISILGLLLACGLLGGLAALIYGIVKGSLTGTIGGGVVLGVSAIFSIILVLIVKCCFKNNNADLNTSQPHPSTDEHQHKRNRRVKHEEIGSHEITVISEMHKYDQQQHPHPHQQLHQYDKNTRSSIDYTDRLTDSTNRGYGKQIQKPSTKITPIDYLNQSNH